MAMESIIPIYSDGIVTRYYDHNDDHNGHVFRKDAMIPPSTKDL